MITIAHNVCRQRFRQAQRRPHEVEFDERVGEGVEDEITTPTAADLRRALSHLAPTQRAALVMRELEGYSYAQIAEVLGISVSALETVLFRARHALREQLEEQLTCEEAVFTINKQLDGRVSFAERRSLRAHLRACAECQSLAQSQRAQRRALKALVLVPLPVSISHWMGGPNAAAATGATFIVARSQQASGHKRSAAHTSPYTANRSARPAPGQTASAQPLPSTSPEQTVTEVPSTALTSSDASTSSGQTDYPVQPPHPVQHPHPAQPPHPVHPPSPQTTPPAEQPAPPPSQGNGSGNGNGSGAGNGKANGKKTGEPTP